MWGKGVPSRQLPCPYPRGAIDRHTGLTCIAWNAEGGQSPGRSVLYLYLEVVVCCSLWHLWQVWASCTMHNALVCYFPCHPITTRHIYSRVPERNPRSCALNSRQNDLQFPVSLWLATFGNKQVLRVWRSKTRIVVARLNCDYLLICQGRWYILFLRAKLLRPSIYSIELKSPRRLSPFYIGSWLTSFYGSLRFTTLCMLSNIDLNTTWLILSLDPSIRNKP